MSTDLVQRAVADLQTATKELAVKKRLLQEVFCDLRELETDRGGVQLNLLLSVFCLP